MIRVKEYKHDEPFHKLEVMAFVASWNYSELFDRVMKRNEILFNESDPVYTGILIEQ